MNPDTPLLTQTLPEHSAQDPTGIFPQSGRDSQKKVRCSLSLQIPEVLLVPGPNRCTGKLRAILLRFPENAEGNTLSLAGATPRCAVIILMKPRPCDRKWNS